MGFMPLLAEKKTQTLLVFDAFGSMWGEVNGEAKIVTAKKVIKNFVKDFPDASQLGLMVYGHRKKGDCGDIEVMIPIGSASKETFLEKVDSIKPKGMTPLGHSLKKAGEILAMKEAECSIILITDGLENCNCSPCDEAKKLEAQGISFKAHVIAFDLKAKDAQKIKCIADLTGGLFFTSQRCRLFTRSVKNDGGRACGRTRSENPYCYISSA